MATPTRQSITEQLVRYFVIFQKLAYVARELPDRRNLYTKAVRQYQQTSPLARFPPPGDEVKRAEFIAKCDEICNSQPTNPLEYGFFSYHNLKPLSGWQGN